MCLLVYNLNTGCSIARKGPVRKVAGIRRGTFAGKCSHSRYVSCTKMEASRRQALQTLYCQAIYVVQGVNELSCGGKRLQ